MKLSVFTLIMFIIFGLAISYATPPAPLKVVERNLKTKEEIARYLNSLPTEDLIELHALRQEIRAESALTLIFGGAGTGSALAITGLTSVLKIESQRRKRNPNPRRLLRLERLAKTAVSLSALGLFAIVYGVHELAHAYEGLGLTDRNGKSVQQRVATYINSLTLEEARGVLADIREINENLNSLPQ